MWPAIIIIRIYQTRKKIIILILLLLLLLIIIIIVTIINCSSAYIIRNLSSEALQIRIVMHNHEQGHTKVIIRTRDHRRCLVEKQNWSKYDLYRKVGIASGDFKVARSSFHTLGAATEKHV